MKVLICPDSFKGSVSASTAANAIAGGVLAACPDAVIDRLPLADGGEGTVEALIGAVGGEIITETVSGPFDFPVEAFYGVLSDGTAVIEMAAAAGLDLIPESRRNPLLTTTYGVGELILSAYKRGCRKFIIGIGGSATNDGGAGAISALGVRFLDRNGHNLPPGGAALAHLDRIDLAGMLIDTTELDIRVACDVTNPLIGETGASAVYGPQKGATEGMVSELDAALRNYAAVINLNLGIDIAEIPGAGAAGGLGGGLLAFLGGKLERGIEIVLDVTNFDTRLADVDLIFTGEGRVDHQTPYGKTIAGILSRAKRFGIPVVILAGSVGQGAEALLGSGATAIFSIAAGPMTLEDSISHAESLLRETAANCVRLFASGHR